MQGIIKPLYLAVERKYNLNYASQDWPSLLALYTLTTDGYRFSLPKISSDHGNVTESD